MTIRTAFLTKFIPYVFGDFIFIIPSESHWTFPSPLLPLVSDGCTENRSTFSCWASSCPICRFSSFPLSNCWGLQPDESVCCAYVAVIVVPQGLLLINVLLALIDRYFAIYHPLLHREKMTNRLACCLTCSILTTFLLKFVYIVGLGILRCELLLLYVKMTSVIFTILFVSCTAMNIVVYRQTKILLRESRTVETTRDEGTRVSNDSDNANNHSTVVSPMSIHVGKKKLGQLEMEATRTLIMGVTSLCVMPFLNIIFIATFFVCRLVFEQLHTWQLQCSNLNGMGYLIIEISLTPAVYGPVIFLVRYKELRSTWACQIIR